MKKRTKVVLATAGLLAAGSSAATTSVDSPANDTKKTPVASMALAESVVDRLMDEGEKKPKPKLMKVAAKKKTVANKSRRGGEPEEDLSKTQRREKAKKEGNSSTQ